MVKSCPETKAAWLKPVGAAVWMSCSVWRQRWSCCSPHPCFPGTAHSLWLYRAARRRAGTQGAVWVKVKCLHFRGQIMELWTARCCWPLGLCLFPLFVAQVPIGAVSAPLSPSGCWQHIPCPALAEFALERDVRSGLGWDPWNFLPYFPMRGPVPRGRAAWPLLSFGMSWGHSFACHFWGWELRTEPGPSWGCICFLYCLLELFKSISSEILKSPELP